MGEHNVAADADESARRRFTRAVLRDLEALELMIDRGMVESGTQRIGFEQEMFLVDADGYAAPGVYDLMEHLIADGRFQTEIALFNLEANLGIHPLRGSFLSHLEVELRDVLRVARDAAQREGLGVVLTGTLPSLRRSDVVLENLTPEIRYQQLNKASLLAQGGAIQIMVDGIERFEQRFDSVVIEGANTSIQLHLQIDAQSAARSYNLAQLMLGPLLAAASNSPVLLGKRVWPETRVAVFERAMDDRSTSQMARDLPTRVGFGTAWLEESILELFHDNVSRYSAIVTQEFDEDPVELVRAGKIPTLRALCLHNGTVWRWNRPCYGITNGKAHLRIENRILPAGPTALDEIANAALFYGLMSRLDDEYGSVRERLNFADARANFLASAHEGLNAQLRWLDERRVSVRDLLLDELIPLAREGLAAVEVPDEEIDRFLGVIRKRVERGRTGAAWLLSSLSKVAESQRPALCLEASRFLRDAHQLGTPVHEWDDVELGDGKELAPERVSDLMTRDVFTVRPDDLIDLAASVMRWKHIRHIPVEDAQGQLVGILGAREVLKLHAASARGGQPLPVRDAMNRDITTVPPELPVSEAIDHILASGSGCLLVVRGEHLLGIVTERDLLRACRAASETWPPPRS